MSLALLVYSISVLPKLSYLLLWGAWLSTIITFIIICGSTLDKGGICNTPLIKKAAIFAAALFFLNAFIPSEKTAYTMVAAYAAQKVAQDPKVQQLSGKVLTVIEQKLDSYIAEGAKAADKVASGV